MTKIEQFHCVEDRKENASFAFSFLSLSNCHQVVIKARCQFDSVKNILHNLVSLLLKQNAKAKCSGKQVSSNRSTEYEYAVLSTLFFKNLTTDKCGRLE